MYLSDRFAYLEFDHCIPEISLFSAGPGFASNTGSGSDFASSGFGIASFGSDFASAGFGFASFDLCLHSGILSLSKLVVECSLCNRHNPGHLFVGYIRSSVGNFVVNKIVVDSYRSWNMNYSLSIFHCNYFDSAYRSVCHRCSLSIQIIFDSFTTKNEFFLDYLLQTFQFKN